MLPEYSARELGRREISAHFPESQTRGPLCKIEEMLEQHLRLCGLETVAGGI